MFQLVDDQNNKLMTFDNEAFTSIGGAIGITIKKKETKSKESLALSSKGKDLVGSFMISKIDGCNLQLDDKNSQKFKDIKEQNPGFASFGRAFIELY